MLADQPAIIIHQDGGGYLGEYVQREQAWEAQGVRIIIDGQCLSACTFYTRSRTLCVTPKAEFGFHQTPDRDAGSAKSDRFALSLYPTRVRAWINRHGGLQRDLIMLRGREMLSMFRRCVSNGQRETRADH